MLSKGDIVINPKTQRPVKVGSRVWRTLVKEGLFEGSYKDPRTLYEVQPDEKIEEKIEELNQTLPPNQQAVRGRGKYKNKIVRRNKQAGMEDVIKYTTKTAVKAIKNTPDIVEEEEEDMETLLENLILKELMGCSQPPPEKKEDYQVESDTDSDF